MTNTKGRGMKQTALTHGVDVITEVIRPAAIVPEAAARAILTGMATNSVHTGGCWLADPSCWARYDYPWPAPDDRGQSHLLGTIQVAYGTPTKYEITIYQVTITQYGAATGLTVAALCDEALGFGELTLAGCPRATLVAPPKPFRF